uniref:Lipoprotein n=1 Tax=Strongyloides venezuelensis TaxID=75913 RepID=A0A0K0FJU7_STRVS
MVIILFLINCDFILPTEENDDDSEENDDDQQDVKFTEEVTPLLSDLYNILNKNGEESTREKRSSLLHSDSSGIYSGKLYEGDIILTKEDVKEFVAEVKKEATNQDKISDIVKKIEDLIKENESPTKEN